MGLKTQKILSFLGTIKPMVGAAPLLWLTLSCDGTAQLPDGTAANTDKIMPTIPGTGNTEEPSFKETPKPPLPFTASVDSDAILVGEKVTCAGTTTSPIKSPLKYHFRWLTSDSPDGEYKALDGEGAAVLYAEPKLAHKWVRCVISAKDEGGLETPSSQSPTVAIANSAPLDFIPATSSELAVVGESLTCAPSGVDPDGDKLTYTYLWESRRPTAIGESARWREIPGSENESLTVSLDLVGGEVRCVAEASDYLGRSTKGMSRASEIRNRVPQAFFADVSSTAPKIGEIIGCDGQSIDPDGGSLSYRYRWGYSASEAGPFEPIPGATLPRLKVTSGEAHKYLRCTITAIDANGGATESQPLQPVVSVANTAPSSFSSFTSSAETEVRQTVECRSMARDVDGDSIAYRYEWYVSGSTEGEMTPIENEIYASLNIKPSFSRKYIRCRTYASDSYGGETISAVSPQLYVKNVKPRDFTTGLTPSEASIGDKVSCTGETSDIDENQIDYRIDWFWSAFETGPFRTLADKKNRDLTIDDSLAHKFVMCRLTADDGVGGVTPAQASPVTKITNTAPEAFDAKISPIETPVGTSVLCGGSTTDVDLDVLTYRRKWMVSGAPGGPWTAIQGNETNEMPINSALAHKYLKCAITADDNHGGITHSKESEVAGVINTAPAAFNSNLPETPVAVGDTAVCGGMTHDIDGDIMTPSYRWEVAERESGPFLPLDAQTERLSITPAHSRKYLRCIKTMSDGWGGITEGATSGVLSVLNTPPNAFTTKASPEAATVGNFFTCSGATTDDDLDDVTYSYGWFAAGSLNGSYSPLRGEKSSTIAISPAIAHKYLKCRMTAFDPYGGTTDSDLSPAVYVLNTPPADFTVTNSQATIRLGESSSCLGSTTDIDLDTLTPAYEWYRSPSPGGPYERLYAEESVSKEATLDDAHTYLKCRMRISDGYGGETFSPMGPTVTVANTAPFPFKSSITPLQASVNNTLTCSGFTSDIDGDTVTRSSYRWYASAQNDGTYTPVEGASSGTLTLGNNLAHLYFKCSITVTDGWGGTTVSALSEAAYYVNTAPDIFSAGVSSETAPVAGAVTCLGTTTDVDADTLTYRDQWYSSQSAAGTFLPINSATDVTYVIPPSQAHRFLRCERTATDGYGGVTVSIRSPVVTVTNTAPDLGVQTARTVAEAGTISFAVSGYADIDGDIPTYQCVSCPTGASIDAVTGVFTFAAGYYDDVTRASPTKTLFPTIRANDGWGGRIDVTLQITVTNTDRPPTIGVTCPSSPKETDTMYFTYAVSDPDGDPLTVKLIGGMADGSFTNESGNSRMRLDGSYDFVVHTIPKPTPNWTRTETVTLEVSYNDALNPRAAANASCSFTMEDVDRAPIANDLLNDQSNNYCGDWFYDSATKGYKYFDYSNFVYSVWDPDGDEATATDKSTGTSCKDFSNTQDIPSGSRYTYRNYVFETWKTYKATANGLSSAVATSKFRCLRPVRWGTNIDQGCGYTSPVFIDGSDGKTYQNSYSSSLVCIGQYSSYYVTPSYPYKACSDVKTCAINTRWPATCTTKL